MSTENQAIRRILLLIRHLFRSGAAIPSPYGVAGIPPSAFNEEAWQRFLTEHPAIPWTEPINMSTFTGNHGLGCRICILRYGLSGCNVNKLPQTLEEFTQHQKEYHRREKP